MSLESGLSWSGTWMEGVGVLALYEVGLGPSTEAGGQVEAGGASRVKRRR